VLKPGEALVSRFPGWVWDQFIQPVKSFNGDLCVEGDYGWEHRSKGDRKQDKRGQEGEFTK